ncbi:metallophosphoesterase family protein [Candidatus Poriferisodalis sp.]|uniref:metallophosphoesterase family protein n=1 Tax=Candidatus Poriferisodalis sp. TaxID=3101277 RepID=UPI003B019E50
MPKFTPYTFTTDQTWDAAPRLHADAVRSVLAVGDVHGEAWHLRKALTRAEELQVDAIVQVGDFWLSDTGWRDHDLTEAKFMRLAHQSPIPIVVIDGNHEVWPALTRFAATPAAQQAFESRRPLHLGGSLWWAWRGSVWQWSTARFGALGGAVSPDREDSDVRRWRWPEEATTQADLDRLLANVRTDHDGRLDVLVTHDSPAQVQGLTSSLDWAPHRVRRDCDAVRRLLADAVDRIRPQIVVHGHWHRANREHIDHETEVVGLANDGRSDHLALLTLSDPPRVEYQPR